MIFVDTGGWFAAYMPSDPDYRAAKAWFVANRVQLVTTDYVIDELLTLARARGESRRGIVLGTRLIAGDLCKIEFVRPDDFAMAWDLFVRFDDKAWSFTDCVSRVVMDRLGIKVAFALDAHFRQFGTITVVP